MSIPRFTLPLLYNDDSHIRHGGPQDSAAIQSTVATSQGLYQAMLDLGYPAVLVPVRDSLDEVARCLQAYPRERTLVFNNCDGFDGSNQAAGLIAHLLEDLGLKHTGASAEAVDLCIDKALANQRLREHGIPTPLCQVFETPEAEFRLDFPVIVKPAVEDGSIGITLDSVVSTIKDLRQQVRLVLETYEEPAVVEQFIAGRELAVAMLGNETVELLPIAEDDYSLIENPLARLLTYESKWDPESSYYKNIPSRIPAELDPADEARVHTVAEGTFRAIGLRDFGRIDIRLKAGIPYVIDINELPDLALDGGFWKSAEQAGMTYTQMIDKIIRLALQREGLEP